MLSNCKIIHRIYTKMCNFYTFFKQKIILRGNLHLEYFRAINLYFSYLASIFK